MLEEVRGILRARAPSGVLDVRAVQLPRSVALGVVDGILGTNGALGGLYSLAVLIPYLAVSVRRLHDTDRSGWWILVNIIPLIGWIIYLVFLCSDSKPGENRFGANPKGM